MTESKTDNLEDLLRKIISQNEMLIKHNKELLKKEQGAKDAPRKITGDAAKDPRQNQ